VNLQIETSDQNAGPAYEYQSHNSIFFSKSNEQPQKAAISSEEVSDLKKLVKNFEKAEREGDEDGDVPDEPLLNPPTQSDELPPSILTTFEP